MAAMGLGRVGWFLVLLCLVNVPCLEVYAAADMRILVDVSGSMKQSDPDNLRVPALKLLADLMPPGSRVGVWLFDQKAHELLAPRVLDQATGRRLHALASQIHSRGAYTDIEGVLRKAIHDWQGTSEERAVMLLTDGKVDISSNPDESQSSRQRIISELIPALQQIKARVYSVALSDQADAPLLRQLSESTGGWFEVAHDASALQKKFLNIYKKAIPHESVPIINNDFRVDARVQEFSVVVFLKPGARPTRIKPPNSRAWGQANVPATARWRHEAGYDLVTVHSPDAGTWKLEADLDPDNQVVVVTDLKLEHTPPPALLHQGDQLDLAAWLTEKGKMISDQAFLDVVAMTASLVAVEPPESQSNHVLQPDKAMKGRFVDALPAPEHPGRYVLTLRADGGSFQRLQEHTIERLPDWVSWAISTAKQDGNVLKVSVSPNPGAMDVSEWLLEAMVADGGGKDFHPLTVSVDGVNRLIDVPMPERSTVKLLALRISGRSLLGEVFSAVLPSIQLTGDMLQTATPHAGAEAESEHLTPPVTPDIHEPAMSPPDAHTDESALIQWPGPEELRFDVIVLSVVNILGVVLFFAWRAKSQKTRKKMLEDIQRKLNT